MIVILIAIWLADGDVSKAVASSGFDWSDIFTTSVCGGLLAFFLTRLEPKLEKMIGALERNTKGTMLSIIANEYMHSEMKKQAQALVEAIDEAKK